MSYFFRWFCIPWLIYVMLVVVALCLISVLQVVISLGASKADPDWPEIIAVSVGCLGLAGMYLYFWIVVLELFIKIGPLYYMTPGLIRCTQSLFFLHPLADICDVGGGCPLPDLFFLFAFKYH